MKYLVVLKKAAVAPIGFDTPEQAVADFLLKCSKITPDGVIAEMKKRILSSKKRKGGFCSRRVICVETQEVFDSVHDAVSKYGTTVAKIIGKGKKTKGRSFEYKDSEK